VPWPGHQSTTVHNLAAHLAGYGSRIEHCLLARERLRRFLKSRERYKRLMGDAPTSPNSNGCQFPFRDPFQTVDTPMSRSCAA
jgi:hypothetical protein